MTNKQGFPNTIEIINSMEPGDPRTIYSKSFNRYFTVALWHGIDGYTWSVYTEAKRVICEHPKFYKKLAKCKETLIEFLRATGKLDEVA